jgi:hypothetical protein
LWQLNHLAHPIRENATVRALPNSYKPKTPTPLHPFARP